MEGYEPQTQQFFRLDQMLDIGPTEALTSITATTIHNGTMITGPSGLSYGVRPRHGTSRPVPGHPCRKHAIKHVHPLPDHPHHLIGMPQAHHITGPILRHPGLARVNRRHHFGFRFPHAHPSYRVPVESDFHQPLHASLPQIRLIPTLPDPKKEVFGSRRFLLLPTDLCPT